MENKMVTAVLYLHQHPFKAFGVQFMLRQECSELHDLESLHLGSRHLLAHLTDRVALSRGIGVVHTIL
jgi:hypothetical protein